MTSIRIDFPPYQLDLGAWQLRRDGEPVRLRPKTLAVLRFLAERPGELVTKQALLDAVWPGIAVTEDVVRLSAAELRAALGDDRSAPRFIETVPRLGYRFVARMGTAGAAVSGADPPASTARRPVEPAAAQSIVVGRERERAEIAEWLRGATSGRRQLAFVTGEAGIGKTTLVDTALREHERTSGTAFRIARGQCIEQYGGGEPYKPVLEVIAELRRGANGRENTDVDETLRARAPRWLLEAIGASPTTRADGDDGARSPAFDSTLHVLASTLAALAEHTPLVLVFEDVHWSDSSTLDLLSALAHGREPARLLVLCTLRPADAIVRGHPLMTVKRELVRKKLCREILLGGLSADDVASYLRVRFADAQLPDELTPLLIERSDGNPFFVVTLVDHLLGLGVLSEGEHGWVLRSSREALRRAIPDGLRAVIEPRLERLGPSERSVLESASIIGLEFAAHAVAATAKPGNELGDVEAVEAVCDGLARRQEILRASGEAVWPDGTRSARYAFRHALYQQVVDQGLAPSLRRRLHQTVGEQLETAWAGQTENVASALAAHFEQSGDLGRAVRYHGEAAARARSRFAFQETRLHVESALRLMRQQPETDEALSRQMPLLDDLAWASFVRNGWGDEGAARAYAQMRDLAERLDATAERFKAMHGELVVHAMRADYATARQRGEEMLRLGEEAGDRNVLGAALPLAASYLSLGDLESAGELAERIADFLDLGEPELHAIACCQFLSTVCAHRGLVARSRERIREALALAARTDVPYLRAYATSYTASVHVLLRDATSARPLLDETIRVAEAAGLAVLPSVGRLYRAWCDLREGRGDPTAASDAASAALDQTVASGQRIMLSALYVTAGEAHLYAGHVDRALGVLESGLRFAVETGERSSEHELLRVKGECLIADGARTARGSARARKREAVACFERAIASATEQKALLFELRATVSLCRVQPKSARERLARLVDRFAPQDDCGDLREAVALLEPGLAS